MTKLSRSSLKIENGAIFIERRKLNEFADYYDSQVGDLIFVNDRGETVVFEVAGFHGADAWLLRLSKEESDDAINLAMLESAAA